METLIIFANILETFQFDIRDNVQKRVSITEFHEHKHKAHILSILCIC